MIEPEQAEQPRQSEQLSRADLQNGLVPRATLSPIEVEAILAFVRESAAQDGFELDVPEGVIRHRPGTETNDFLFYDAGRLVGYLYLVSYGGPDKEICAVVHPAFRRRGIFKQLAAAAIEAARERGLKSLLFVVDGKSAAGRPAVEVLGGRYKFSEHRMVRSPEQHGGSAPPLPATDPAISLRPVEETDVPLMTGIAMACFGDSPEEAEQHVRFGLRSNDRHPYAALLNGEPIGMISVVDEASQVYIAGFGVVPDHRRRGHGRQILARAVSLAEALGRQHILLEVETRNEGALALYIACGFQRIATFEYFDLGVG